MLNEIDLEKYSVDKFKDKLSKSIKRNLKPAQNLDIVEWAERYYVLSSDDSAEAGKYRSSRAIYQREILETIGDPLNHEIVLMTGAQCGKTLIQLLTLAYYSHQRPSPILFVLPDVSIAEDFSKRRLAPMIRNSPVLKDLFKNNDTGTNNTILSKFYPGGSIYLASAGIATDLTSRPVRVVLCDEADKFSALATAGDPINLAKQRTATFPHNKKIILTSTPLVDGESRIQTSYENGTQGVYHHTCIHCHTSWAPKWEHVKWSTINDEPLPSTATLVCPHCGGCHNDSERQRSMDTGTWIHQYPDRKVKSFHLNSISSPWVSLEDLVEQYITAIKEPSLYRQFVNEVLGLPYASMGEKIDDVEFGNRLEEYTKTTIPDEVLFLTAGCDTQSQFAEAVVYGWGANYESWVVDHFRVYGPPDDPNTWESLHQELQQDYTNSAGQKLKLLKIGIDTGGATDEIGGFSTYVKAFCKKYARWGYMPFKGASTPQRSIFPAQKRQKSQIYLIDVSQGKDFLYGNLRKTKPGAGYVHFYNGLSPEFFHQLTSEEKIKVKKSGRTTSIWKRIGNRAAETLDASVYALASRLALPVNIEKTYQNWRINAKNTQIIPKSSDISSDIDINNNTEDNTINSITSATIPPVKKQNPRFAQQYFV